MARQESSSCPDCGGRGTWTEKQTSQGQEWDAKLKKMVSKPVTVTIDMRCSGRCGGSGIVYK